ncbi:m141 protein [Murid betaherpesvirus 1]|nr:m141 protein [Murid betaherpesvirus 1]
MERPVTANAISAYKRVIDAFSRLVATGGDQSARRRAIERLDGKVIPLGFPQDWYVVCGSGKSCWSVLTDRATALLCCEETLIPLGLCGRTADPYDTRGLRGHGVSLVLSGEYGRVYVYTAADDTLHLVARNLEELGRFGISRRSFAYKEDMQRSVPRADLVRLRYIASCDVPRGYPGMELLVVFSDPNADAATSVGYTRFVDGKFVRLTTPGYGTSALFLAKDPGELRGIWPFRGMCDPEFKRCWNAVSDALHCSWSLIGVLGYRPGGLPDAEFRADHVIVADKFGAVYSLLVYSRAGLTRRVADSVAEFFQMGMLKRVFSSSFEFRQRERRKERLESMARCPHWPEQKFKYIEENCRDRFDSPTADEDYVPADCMAEHYAWLVQSTVKVHSCRPWDLDDPNVAPRALVTNADTGDPMKTYWDRLESAIAKVKLTAAATASDVESSGGRYGEGPYVYKLSPVPPAYFALTCHETESMTMEEVYACRRRQFFCDTIVPFYRARPGPSET